MNKDSPPTRATLCFSAPRCPRFGIKFGSDAITPIPPNGFALAAGFDFMLSGPVVLPEQDCLLLARTAEIPAQLVEELAFNKPGNLTRVDWRSMNS
jgi:hypothetical protein